ncbi:MAG: hypothetical protein HQK87_10665 [Nitrospinae bacterium]|nr:hypothetical protein [Nitrospinota bacterium]
MKHVAALFVLLSLTLAGPAMAAPIATYLDLGPVAATLDETEAKVKEALAADGFTLLGSYAPMGDAAAYRVVVYTHDDLLKALGTVAPQRGLAAALKVGLRRDAETSRVTMTNPDLIFRAYLQGDYAKVAAPLGVVAKKAVGVFTAARGFAGKAAPMGGGDLDSDEVADYHYMFGMEYFGDQVKLSGTKADFAARTKAIEARLADGSGGMKKVFSVTIPRADGKRVAVYGVGLLDPKKGEPFFLPIIGVDHLAALPYELVVIDTDAYMLHGRYRIALHWPALTMGTFTKIISTPGEIEEQLREVVRVK